jgi:hypothetical protein
MYCLNQCPPEEKFILDCSEKDINSSKYDLLSEVGLREEWNKEEEARKWAEVNKVKYDL